MPRAMIFIDGTWLYKNRRRLEGEYGEKFVIDYGKIRPLIKNLLQQYLEGAEVDIVRVYLFGSYPVNVAPEDQELAKRQYEFYMDRKKKDQFEVELFEIDFRGMPIRKRPAETVELEEPEQEKTEFEKKEERAYEKPKEKCVDIALATSMLFYAAIPYAYDIAIPVIGDIDYMPVLQHVRRLGKRVFLVSIRGSCPKVFWDPEDPKGIRDFPIIYLNDYLDQLQLKEERRQCIYCKKWFPTTYKGDKPICPECMEKLKKREHDDSLSLPPG
jgi:uncharacterized LabA/DUF88 family protein